MARPRKEGLDYFPLSVHFDEKIKALELLHKNDGLVWIIKFWQNAYQTNSGEVNLKGLFGVIQAENCRITIVKQAEIIRNCLELGLITMISDDVYTSNGIQKRLNEIVKDREFERKRKLVASFPLENLPLIGESKVKKSKVNNICIHGDTEKPTAKRSLGQKAVDVYLLKYKDITGLDYIPSWGKHVRLLNTVLKNMRGEEYEECVDRYLSSQKGREVKYSLDFFIATINTWRETSD